MKRKVTFFILIILMNCFSGFSQKRNRKIIERNHKSSITPIELDYGEMVRYTTAEGQILTMELVGTEAKILYTNKDKIPPNEAGNDRGNSWRARLMYEFNCDLKINGQEMTMQRYIGSQEAFYEPYVINGVRIWFDGVREIFEEDGGFLNSRREANGIPGKKARFLLQDMNSRICPGDLHAWFIDGEERGEN